MSDGALVFDTKLDTSGLSTGLSGIGNVAGTAFKGVAVAAGAAATAVGALTKSSLDGYAAYEQLTGGIETLFKDSSGIVMQYAENAYKTAGMSANTYMETVTSFSASLIQGLDGDTAKAAEKANMAISDMSDNANKMGSSLESIQNAYQGFAKQNYSMLDNLKLGYGGTQSEMFRLMQDAAALNEEFAKTADFSMTDKGQLIADYSDIVDAIHIVQSEMGITGTTALEASSTIEGSTASMKAAWGNLVTGLADENANLDVLIDQFIDSVITVGENVIPRIEVILAGIGQLVEKMVPQIVGMLPGLITDVLPQLLSAGVALVDSLITGITGNIGSLMDLVLSVVMQLVDVIIKNLPKVVDAGAKVIIQLIEGIAEAVPTLIPAIVEVLLTIVQTLIDNLPMLLEVALELILALVDGILAALPTLIAALPAIILSIVDFILGAIPQIIQAGIQLLTSLVDALPEIITSIVEAIPKIIDGIITAVLDALPSIIQAGIDLLVALVQALPVIITTIVDAIPQIISGIIDAVLGNLDRIILAGVQLFVALVENLPRIIVEIVKAVPQIITSIVKAFGSLASKMASVGGDIVKGLWKGLSDSFTWIKGKIEGWVGNVMSFFKKILGIASPSKEFKWIGEMCVAGFDEGLEPLMDGSAITRSINATVNTLGANTSHSGGRITGGFNQVINVNKEVGTPDELARAVRLESRYGLMKGVSFA